MRFLPRLPFRAKDPELLDRFVSLDIGTHQVKVAFCLLTDTGVQIDSIGVADHTLTAMRGGIIGDLEEVSESVQQAIASAAELYEDSLPDVAIVGVSGEMTKGFTTVLRLTREHAEEPISERDLEDMQRRVAQVSFEKARHFWQREYGDEHISVELMSTKITSLKIDGRPVSDPLGLRGRSIDIYNFSAYCPSVFLSSLQQVLKRSHLHLITASSLSYALVESLSSKEPTESNFILIDVGGEDTDLSLVFEGGIDSIETIGIGGRSFTRAVAVECDLSFAEAEELKLAYSNEKLSGEAAVKVRKALTQAGHMWLSAFSVALQSFEHVSSFPTRILLAGGGSQLPLLKELLHATPWHREVPFMSFPKMRLVEKRDILGVVDPHNLIVDSSLLPVMALAVVGAQVEGASHG